MIILPPGFEDKTYISRFGLFNIDEPEDGFDYKCDRCGKIHKHDEQIFRFYWSFVNQTVFAGRPKPKLPDFCGDCCKAVTPLIFALRDIDELQLFTNNLKRAIDEKRKQRTENNRTTPPNACNSGEGRAERRLGH